MISVACFAYACAFLAYVQRWESRRSVMYQQRDLTRSIMLAVKQDIAAPGRFASVITNEGESVTYTSHWTERLEAWETRNGEPQPLIRVLVSGDNGSFSLPPITVQISGSSLDGPWIDRLLRAYQAKGWRYKVVQQPAG